MTDEELNKYSREVISAENERLKDNWYYLRKKRKAIAFLKGSNKSRITAKKIG